MCLVSPLSYSIKPAAFSAIACTQSIVAATEHARQSSAATRGSKMSRYRVDIAAVGFFALEWLVHAMTLEHSTYGRDSLSARMNRYRSPDAPPARPRDVHGRDYGLAPERHRLLRLHFSSTSLFAIGGALALLRASDDALVILSSLPIDLSPSPAL
jgi:uncharacterized membrane protein